MVRQAWRGLLWAIQPSAVVEDDGETLVEWRPRGAIGHFATSRGYPGRDHLPRGERQLASMETCEWFYRSAEEPISTLSLVRVGDWYRTSLGWGPDGSFLGWYVNFQEPMVRRPFGYDTMDLVIDMVVNPALQYGWKDRDDFDSALDRGIFEPEVRQAVDVAAEQVLQELRALAGAFAPQWREWRPAPSVGVPQLPQGLDSGLARPPGSRWID